MIDPNETVFIDVYLQSAAEAAGDPAAPSSDTAVLSPDDASRLAGTVAFTEANSVGEEEYFIINVPQGMRFDAGAAIVTIALSGLDGPIGRSAVELRKASLVR